MENIPTVRFYLGETIFKEGDASNNVYLIISGKVQISRYYRDHTVVLAEQGKDTIFGEMAIVDGKSRSATAMALEPTFCYKCSSVQILKELAKLDQQVLHTLKHLSAIIRNNNEYQVRGHNDIATYNSKNTIYDESVKEPFLTYEEITNDQALQKKVAELSPFLGSVYRVLLQIAFKK